MSSSISSKTSAARSRRTSASANCPKRRARSKRDIAAFDLNRELIHTLHRDPVFVEYILGGHHIPDKMLDGLAAYPEQLARV